MASKPKIYDLLIVTDATGSMGSFLTSLNASLQDIIRISTATDCFSRIGVIAYRDYDHTHNLVTQFSGWYSRHEQSKPGTEPRLVPREELLDFVSSLRPTGGADWPEATRTGLARAHEVIRPEAKTIILLFADAPPHSKVQHGNWEKEQKVLQEADAYGGSGPLFADWVEGARQLRDGDKKAQVFSLIEWPRAYYELDTINMFLYLSAITGGVCLGLHHTDKGESISKATIALLLTWMGVTKQGSSLDDAEAVSKGDVPLTHYSYESTEHLADLEDERDARAKKFLMTRSESYDKDAFTANLRRDDIFFDALATIVPRREEPVQDFSKRYAADPAYRELAVEQIEDIIKNDVTALALNPVFGSLWRTVCNDRANEARDRLVAEFSRQLEKIKSEAEKARMKAWLEESYDWAAEIAGIIADVPEEERFPCVFLDPTAVRLEDVPEDEEEEDLTNAQRLRKFTRDELLDLGRACDRRILRRLGAVLTRLSYVETAESLPAHVRDAAEDVVPRIPIALAQPKHRRNFWRVLLHTILPGTYLSKRPAALLAALSIRMGIKPLEHAAITELKLWKDQWNTLDIPETWSSGCLGLLLEADQAHRKALAQQDADDAAIEAEAILKPEDRRLFETLLDYKLLELNLDTTLTARMGWTPRKTLAPLGPFVVCKGCQLPRSVTILSGDSVCGLCVGAENTALAEEERAMFEQRRHLGASKTDNEQTLVTWVECFVQTCRAQYVVYNPDSLNVRPKCHRCRHGAKTIPDGDGENARLATCYVCANRVIYPSAYRPADFNPATYTCPACTWQDVPGGPTKTIVEVETTPRALQKDNGTDFLLRNDNKAIPDPLAGRSLFYTVSNSSCMDNLTSLPEHVTILPWLNNSSSTATTGENTNDNTQILTIAGKPLLNTPSLLTTLHTSITRRQTTQVTCPLCLTSHPLRFLHPACGAPTRLLKGGRKIHGCGQLACRTCLTAWYATPHRRGSLIFPAALACPFCRAEVAPSSRAARRLLPREVRTLAGLRDAWREKGEWVYAWCAGPCGAARRYAERVCGGAEGREEVEGWWCEECTAAAAANGGRVGAAGNGNKREEGMRVVKMCPNPACGVAVEKTAGCDHIECQCGKHWCFGCGEMVADTAGEVYKHMSDNHGTWYDGGEWYEDEEEEEEEEDVDMEDAA
ncbi:hypothetical protein VTJ04DRAFT_10357 [Mycothermus thermophilus]|uniref:uncharacterized protein n=1 Tax=Humicola insolens TaxID=85995 RepID=UPI003744968D